ncbi:MAG: molybdenum cofactor guanylyltransferase [Thermoleophilia bacterium]|nr:molybdenum cofactor guanylyltransferase [Thermoleophilia bacterium]
MDQAAIVLAGGRSSRMGVAKADLGWHGEPLVRHLAAVARAGCGGGPVVVVAAPGQELPPLPAWAEVAEDPVEGRGPLQGIQTGLEALAGRADIAFVTGCDVPFLVPAFAARVLALAEGRDAVVPFARGHRQPLLAAFRVALAPVAAALLADDDRKVGLLLDACDALVADEALLLADRALAAADPTLRSAENVNTPEEWEAALAVPLSRIDVTTYGVARLRASVERATASAVRLAQAAAAVGLDLDGYVVAAVNGQQIVADPLYPLGEGDRVAFLGADAGG